MSSDVPQTPSAASWGPTAPGAPSGGPRPYGDRPRYGGGPRRDDRGGDRDRGDRGGSRYGGARRPRRKVCSFCVDKVKKIDYKDVGRIRRYISERGKIDPRRKSGSCAKHQRMLTTALKRARLMAMLPYTADHVRAMMSPQARVMAGGPPPPKPDRPPYRPGGYQPGGPGQFRPTGAPPPAAAQPPAAPPAAAPQPVAPPAAVAPEPAPPPPTPKE